MASPLPTDPEPRLDPGAARAAPRDPGSSAARPASRPGSAPTPFLKRPILLVTPWYGGNLGGVAVSAASTVAALRRIGVPVVVLQMESASSLVSLRRGAVGERVISLSMTPLLSTTPLRTPGRLLRALVGNWVKRRIIGLALWTLVHRYGLRLVHFQYCVESYDEIRRAAERYGLPIVATFRGSEVNVHFDSPEIGGVIRRLIRSAVRITTVSAGLGATLARLSPDAAKKSQVIRNAVPLSVWDAAASHEPEPSRARDIDVLYAGNLVEVKGPDQLLQAFAIVRAALPQAKLVLIGAGTMEAQLRRQVQAAGLEDAVRFDGRVDRTAILEYYSRARVLALPSRNEGMPLAAMEAQIVGVPVVAMDVGGVREVVLPGETGFVVPAGDVKAFADALRILLEDEPRRVQFGKAARRHALAAFDPIDMASRYEAMYEQIAPDAKA